MRDLKLSTVLEVAERLAVHKNTVYRWVKNGKLGAYHLGDGDSARVRIAEEAVEKLLGGIWRANRRY